ncbi:MAG: SixA phosphatase family protein [Anaerolineae bacterium]
MRHAKSKWSEPGVADHDRALTRRGKRAALAMGRELLARGWLPGIVFSSTAKRARGTAKRLVTSWDPRPEIVCDPSLYLQGLAPYLHILSQIAADVHTVLIVGHNPAAEDMVRYLTNETIRLPTASVACVDLPLTSWAQYDGHVEGTLRHVLHARDVVIPPAEHKSGG